MPDPLRVAFLTHVARFSGAEIEMLRVIEAAEGLTATVVLAEDGPIVSALAAAGARVEVLPLSERARGLKRTEVRAGARQSAAAIDVARYIRQLRSRLIAIKPHVVSAVSLKAGAYGGPAARLAGLPFVWHLHDQLASDYLAPQAVLPMRALVATLPNAVIAPSRATLDSVGWFRPRLRTAVIPHPIPIPPQPAEIRPVVKRVGIVGRLAPWKGQDVFLRAFAQAFAQSEVRAVLIGAALFGEEDYAADLRGLASELGITDQVDFRGFQRDVVAELEQLDLLVHASVTPEPFGMSIFEGMAMGLPVVGAAAGGPGEYIEHRTTGLLYPPGAVSELAQMMSLAATDHDLRRRLGSAGRARVREFAPEVVVERWFDVYREVIGRRAATRNRTRP
jgi:glycosyltransferase involved in cell wall biosynthesis